MTGTTNLGLTPISSGQAQKEVTANENFEILASAIANPITIAMADTDQTLATDDAQENATFLCTGALTVDRNLIVPVAVTRIYNVANNTTGGHNIIVKTPSGTGVTIPPGGETFVRCDGTNVIASVKPRNLGEMQAQWVMGAVVTNGTFYFSYKARYAGTITALDSVSGTGTFTVDIEINGTGVTGLSAVAVTSTPATTAASGANTFSAGDTISGVVSSAASSPTGTVLNLNVTWA